MQDIQKNENGFSLEDMQKNENGFRGIFIKMIEKQIDPETVALITFFLHFDGNLDEIFENSLEISKEIFCSSHNKTVSEWEDYSFKLTQLLEKLCDTGGFSLLFRNQLKICGRLFVVETLSFLVKITFMAKSVSFSSDIVHRYKGVNEEITKIIPDSEEFVDFLFNDAVPNQSVSELIDTPFKESLKFFLAKHCLDERFKIFKIYKEIEAINQPLIENSPKQTLPIETTSATVEESSIILLQREIALIYWYDRDKLKIDLKNSQQIAEDNGHKSNTSGRSL